MRHIKVEKFFAIVHKDRNVPLCANNKVLLFYTLSEACAFRDLLKLDIKILLGELSIFVENGYVPMFFDEYPPLLVLDLAS